MTIRKSGLTAFFILLTLSIGLVSINSPLIAKAQNNALSQDGDGAAEQQTEQEQSSTEDNQVISGDTSILSGNSVLCQNQENSDSTIFEGVCEDAISSNPPTNGQLMSIVSIHISRSGDVPSGNWGSVRIQDPSANIDITQKIQSQDRARTFYFNIPVGDHYSVTTSFPGPDTPVTLTLGYDDDEPDCKRISSFHCEGTKAPDQTHLLITARN